MKKMVATLLTILMLASLAACSVQTDGEENTTTSDAEEYMTQLESGDISLSPYEKRTLALAYDTPPAQLQLAAGESYTIELPFETASIAYSTDNPTIVTVSDDGIITPIANGTCMVHVDADGLQFHTIVTVSGTNTLDFDTEQYSAYTRGGFDADIVKSDIEVYASSKCGFTIIDALVDDAEAKSTAYPFTFDYEHPGVNVKYKLLSAIDNLQEKGYSKISVDVSKSDEAILCTFYYE